MSGAHDEIVHLRNHIRYGNILEIGSKSLLQQNNSTNFFLDFVASNHRYEFFSITSDPEIYDENLETRATQKRPIGSLYAGNCAEVLPEINQKFCYIYLDNRADSLELSKCLVNYAADRCVMIFDKAGSSGAQWLLDNGWHVVYKHDKLRETNDYISVANWKVYD